MQRNSQRFGCYDAGAGSLHRGGVPLTASPIQVQRAYAPHTRGYRGENKLTASFLYRHQRGMYRNKRQFDNTAQIEYLRFLKERMPLRPARQNEGHLRALKDMPSVSILHCVCHLEVCPERTYGYINRTGISQCSIRLKTWVALDSLVILARTVCTHNARHCRRANVAGRRRTRLNAINIHKKYLL
jgi:hypothetical protein